MRFGIALRDFNLSIKNENCSLKIIDGNWGIFCKSFTKHMHSYYELHYVSGGQGTLITDSCKTPLKKGCLYLLPPKTNHEQWTEPTDFLEEYHVAFEVTSYSEKDLIWQHLFSTGFYVTNQKDLETFFENICMETAQKQYGYFDMVYQNLRSVFISLVRSVAKLNPEISAPPIILDDRRIMLIDEAILYKYQSVTLASLSDQLKLSARQTQRFIKDKYGVSFSALKFQSRLSHAAMLVSTTKLSMEEICFQVGYKNYSSFSRSFKQHYNMTLADYRKIHSHK